MGRKPTLYDQWGRPLQRAVLTEEVAAPTVGGVRSPLTGYPADGLNPVRLASILREADAGDPVRYMELAETIEERDLHYVGVLGTRRRSVSQLDITVEPASDSPVDEARAQMVRDWLRRDELTSELFDILDAIGKGYSFTEIIWDTSEGQWMPERLEYRDPRWFRFERHNLTKPLRLDENGQEVALEAFKFIQPRIQAKSGLPLRSGLARIAAWGWMFKMFAQRDWAIFTQTYGQPLRVGKFPQGATEEDKETLFRAVAYIAGDMAAIIPQSMDLEFIEAANVGTAHQLYKERADWLDQQVSKAVLGQTATTDSLTGGLGSGKEHREVQEDIERADAKALTAALNRDLLRPWMMLEFGALKAYPKITIARAEQEDLSLLVESIATLIPMGLRVSKRDMAAKLGVAEPDDDEDALQPAAAAPPKAPPQDGPPTADADQEDGEMQEDEETGDETEEARHAAEPADPSPVDLIADRLADDAAPAMEAILDQIEAMVAAAGSLEELREMLAAGFPKLRGDQLTEVMTSALTAALAGGRAALEAESG